MATSDRRNPRKSSKDDGCCSVNFLKYVLFVFNILFYLAGFALIGIAIWTLVAHHDYVPLLPNHIYSITTYLILGAGLFCLLIGILGFIGGIKQNRACLLAYTFLLFLVFLAEAVAGIIAYIYAEQINVGLKETLRYSINSEYGEEGKESMNRAIKRLHENFECCGSYNYTDWSDSVWHKRTNMQDVSADKNKYKVPDFCCISPSNQCGMRDHPSNIYDYGCCNALQFAVRDHLVLIGSIALGISCLQIFGMFVSCCLYVKLAHYKPYRKGEPSYNDPSSYQME